MNMKTKHELINYLLRTRKVFDAAYLEIGVEDPRNCFNRVAAKFKRGVEPDTRLLPKPRGRDKKAAEQFYPMTSAEYFRMNLLRDEPERFDIIMIDGDHDYAACKADIEAALRILKPGGLLVVDDVLCETEWMGRPRAEYKFPEAWKGEAWRAFVEAAAACGYRFATVHLGATGGVEIGVGVIDIGRILQGETFATPTTWADYAAQRGLWLNEMDVERFKAWVEGSEAPPAPAKSLPAGPDMLLETVGGLLDELLDEGERAAGADVIRIDEDGKAWVNTPPGVEPEAAPDGLYTMLSGTKYMVKNGVAEYVAPVAASEPPADMVQPAPRPKASRNKPSA